MKRREKMKCILLPVTLISVIACSSSKDPETTSKEAPASEPSNSANAEGSKATEGPWKGFDKAAMAAKFEGTWLVGGNRPSVWQVKGDLITITKAQGEEPLEFVLVSPCSLKIVTKSEGGSSSTTSKFTWQGETLFLGLGQGGAHLENGTLVACVSADTYTFDGTSCTKWKEDMFKPGTFTPSPAECSVTDGTPKTFSVGSSTLEFGESGALYDTQMKRNAATKFADVEKAKEALLP